ncbi:hypothetical protein [uncultured Dysosmobacter sp.]|uniref:hypothetical protein n=1 Tax=uncultured Dysosmobacter sp. TaxID=2591384 RepID=UPI00261139AB|nr:hypothetical protein [uncultured Dysosmobacter sp.]
MNIHEMLEKINNNWGPASLKRDLPNPAVQARKIRQNTGSKCIAKRKDTQLTAALFPGGMAGGPIFSGQQTVNEKEGRQTGRRSSFRADKMTSIAAPLKAPKAEGMPWTAVIK